MKDERNFTNYLHECLSIVCIVSIPFALALKIFLKKTFTFPIFFFYLSCTVEENKEKNEDQPTVQTSGLSTQDSLIEEKLDYPDVYIEELDQSQEFFKEQHETSFSHVSNKNWFSFTAQKDGILTKILLYGKPNFKPSDHYGDSMEGFIRESNPNSGPKFGEWDLSRDDIVNQIASQGLTERDPGWITIRMRGKIPQIAGKTYFLICNKITGGKPWFGAFAFGEGNPYKPGRFWLHQDHDLVFRSYVGKTPDQVENEQKNNQILQDLNLEKKVQNNNADLSISIPVSQSTASPVIIPKVEPDSKIEPEVKDTLPTEYDSFDNNSSEPQKLNLLSPTEMQTEDSNQSKKKSLFNRLFKNQ